MNYIKYNHSKLIVATVGVRVKRLYIHTANSDNTMKSLHYCGWCENGENGVRWV